MQRMPGIYTAINTQTQRTGLPSQNHRIVFVTGDAAAPVNPTPVYDTATADSIIGTDSNAGRMMAAALTVSQGVRVDAMGKSDAGGGFNPIVCTPTSADFASDYQPSFSGITAVHARYRINNGGWIDYEAEVGVDTPTQVIERFVNSIKDTSGQKLIATSFDTEPTSTPFYCPGGDSAIYSGADPESPLVSFTQMSFDRPLATKIDFAVTATRPNDLVATMFNSDQTVISCGLAFWAYR
ncbi:hypothetical protein [Psychrobacter sp. AT9]|uniref:hypothetical protein n=1 Tax=Psychrobacter sp. AT9 TaxID=3242893 RepID=UPI0039A47EE1